MDKEKVIIRLSIYLALFFIVAALVLAASPVFQDQDDIVHNATEDQLFTYYINATDTDEPLDNSQQQGPGNPSRDDVLRILIEKVQVRRRNLDCFKEEEEVDLLEANGSLKSILDWAKKASLDAEQRRAFEIFVGRFVLCIERSGSSPRSDPPKHRPVTHSGKICPDETGQCPPQPQPQSSQLAIRESPFIISR